MYEIDLEISNKNLSKDKINPPHDHLVADAASMH